VNGIYYRNFDSYAKTSRTLGRVLIPKVPQNIEEVILIPSGRLGTLPFEALPAKIGADFASSKFLVDQLAISYEFSAGLILQKQKTVTRMEKPSIFLCAPVQFPEKDNLNDLPGTEKEVTDIAELFSASNKAVSTRLDANESLVKSGRLESYNYLHFATHGVVDEVEPDQSRIFLNTTDHEDGNLFAGEIYNLSLNADLTVLSACQTGLGKFSKGEGVIGLSRALVYAGARNLIVSFWSVADESTASLMADFYAILLKQPVPDFSKALREAKQKMINENTFREPFYWAPFVLIGY
jgi:CHAT domain-containing protein